MRPTLFLFLCLLVASRGPAQTTTGLSAYYPFDSNLSDATGDSFNGGVESGVVDFDCGISGQAVLLNGGNDFVRIPGGASNNINREFDTEDFTVSLYFKPIGMNGNQFLISKRDTNCTVNQYFFVRYAPITRTVSVTLRQDNQEARVDHRIQNEACWQHLTVVRDGQRVRLYLNGSEVGEAGTDSRVDIDNTGDLLIGSSTCRGNAETAFEGLIDEVRIYNRALRDSEIEELYSFPDRIVTEAGRLFLGESIDVEINSNCGIGFEWSPAEGISDPLVAEPTIEPVAAGRQVYTVRIADGQSDCVAADSIAFQVINPNTLDCSQVFLPKAFTPNGIGPVANETFGISNPFAIPELISFEIYDRYGGQVFQTTDAFERWDGNFRDQPTNPGIMLWRVVYRCEGQELTETGSVTILR